MRTTLDIDDSLLRTAKSRAAEEGISLTSYIERALAAAQAPSTSKPGSYKLRWKPHKGKLLIDPAVLDSRNLLYDFFDRDA